MIDTLGKVKKTGRSKIEFHGTKVLPACVLLRRSEGLKSSVEIQVHSFTAQIKKD